MGLIPGFAPTSILGKGIQTLSKRMTEGPKVKPPPAGYMGLKGGEFTNVGGRTESALKPTVKKRKEKLSKGGMGMKMLNRMVNKGLDMVGAG